MRLLMVALVLGVSACAVPSGPRMADTSQAQQRHEAGHMSTHKATARPLAVSASFDARGQLWLAQVADGHVLISHSDDAGAHFSQPVRVNPTAETVVADGENRPKLVIAADGTLHVAWTVSLARPYSGHVRYSRSRDGGRTFSPPLTVNDDLSEVGHRFEAMAVDGDRVALAWLDARARKAAEAAGRAFAGSSVYYAVSENGGASFGPNRRLADHSCECCRVALAWNNGEAVALWRHVFAEGARDFALAPLRPDAAVRRVSDDDWRLTGCPHHGGALAADAQGGLHLVWYTQGQTRQGLYYRRLDGARESAPLKFGNDDMQAGHPGVLASGGTVTLAWREFDGRSFSAWIMQSRDRGASWESARRIGDSEGAADYPLLLARAGETWLLWNTQREGLRVQRLDGGGA